MTKKRNDRKIGREGKKKGGEDGGGKRGKVNKL